MVHAFEPVPRTFQELVFNVRANALESTVRTWNVALGERKATEALYVPSFYGSVAASARPLFPQQENTTVPVAVERLDDFVAHHGIPCVDLIKCDVEGAELLVLRGAATTLCRHQPVLMLEMLRKWARLYDYHPDAVVDLLAGYGYACWCCERGEFSKVTRVGEQCEATNFFFLHASQHEHIRNEVVQQLAQRQGERGGAQEDRK